MKIIVQIKNVYGNELIYPICDNAKLFTSLTGKQTLSLGDINKIKSLGYVVEVKTKTL